MGLGQQNIRKEEIGVEMMEWNLCNMEKLDHMVICLQGIILTQAINTRPHR